MVAQLMKPVPMINSVSEAGSYVDSDKIFAELLLSGRAVQVDVSSTCPPIHNKENVSGNIVHNKAENSPVVELESPTIPVVPEVNEPQPKKRGRKAKAE